MEGQSNAIANRMKEAREARGLTKTAAAAVLGTSVGHYSQFESGDRTPRAWHLLRLAAYYGVAFDTLFPEYAPDAEEVELVTFGRLSAPLPSAFRVA